MGGPPFKEYTFFFHIGPYADVGGGGMEHANSTAIAATSVESAANVAAHEFFHAWNVKRIRPQALEPVDYSKEQYTRALWFAEGVTSTYGAYALERTSSGPKISFMTTLPRRSAISNRAPRALGKASKSRAWTRGLRNTTTTTLRAAASPITTKARSSACFSISPSATPPTITILDAFFAHERRIRQSRQVL